MTTSTGAKKDRIELRISEEHKQIIEKAASLKGLSLSSYVLSQILDVARAEIASQEKITLSNRDRDLFISLLENPPEPSESLKLAVKRFQDKYEV